MSQWIPQKQKESSVITTNNSMPISWKILQKQISGYMQSTKVE